MRVGFLITQTSSGSSASFIKSYQIVKNLRVRGDEAILLSPYEEKHITDIPMELVPSKFSKFGLSKLSYKAARMMASSSLTSKFVLSKKSIQSYIDGLSKGLGKIIKEKRFDIIHALQPLAAIAVSPIAKKYGIPVINEWHNIWPEEAVVQKQAKQDDDTFKLLRQIEQDAVSSSDGLFVVSEFMRNYVRQNYDTANKPIDVLTYATEIPPFPEEKREDNVIYAGMVNPRSHVDLFAQSIPYVKHKASFFISDRGDAIKEVKKITSKFSNPEVKYVWFDKWSEALKFTMKAKVGILTASNDITWKLGHPHKMFDYLACGVPVVANDVGGSWTEMILKENVGYLSKDEPKDLAAVIDSILEDDTKWHQMHENGLNLIKTRFNWKNNIEKVVIPAYTKIINSS